MPEEAVDDVVLFDRARAEAEVAIRPRETPELEAEAGVGDPVNVTDVAVVFATKLEVVADGIAVAPDVVVRLARRLEAEADEELGAAADTPTLSALMMSAACQRC